MNTAKLRTELNGVIERWPTSRVHAEAKLKCATRGAEVSGLSAPRLRNAIGSMKRASEFLAGIDAELRAAHLDVDIRTARHPEGVVAGIRIRNGHVRQLAAARNISTAVAATDKAFMELLRERLAGQVAETGEPHPQASTNPLDVQVGGGHYKQFKIQPAEIAEGNQLSFLEGCVVKRVHRHSRGGKGVQDLEKAVHELKLLAKLQYGVEL